jgi:Flp pilus assembly protein TadG
MIAVSPGRRKQRGNTVLESALCFLPMMAMFFGIIDVCYAVSIQSLLSPAVRGGSGWAITYQSSYDGNTCASQAVCIAQVVQDNSVAFWPGRNPTTSL